MKWLWTWGGVSFGYRDEQDNLWTHDGRHVGRFYENEVYGKNGRYIGEVMSDNRLITHKGKKHNVRAVFAPYGRVAGFARYANYAGFAMYAGYEDFPAPEGIQ